MGEREDESDPAPPPAPVEAAPEPPAMLELVECAVDQGAEIHVKFHVPEGLPDNAWVGVVPADTAHGDETINDQHDLSYQYLKGRREGTLTFKAPNAVGAYDFRLNDTDSGGAEMAFVTFHVNPVAATLELVEAQVDPGRQIQVKFHVPGNLPANAWIGIVPSDVPHGDETVNDQHDSAYHYLKGQTIGTLTFTAPREPGQYDFRLNDTDSGGKELAFVTFTVKPWGELLKLIEPEVLPEHDIHVAFELPEVLPPSAWIGIVPSEWRTVTRPRMIATICVTNGRAARPAG